MLRLKNAPWSLTMLQVLPCRGRRRPVDHLAPPFIPHLLMAFIRGDVPVEIRAVLRRRSSGRRRRRERHPERIAGGGSPSLLVALVRNVAEDAIAMGCFSVSAPEMMRERPCYPPAHPVGTSPPDLCVVRPGQSLPADAHDVISCTKSGWCRALSAGSCRAKRRDGYEPAAFLTAFRVPRVAIAALSSLDCGGRPSRSRRHHHHCRSPAAG